MKKEESTIVRRNEPRISLKLFSSFNMRLCLPPSGVRWNINRAQKRKKEKEEEEFYSNIQCITYNVASRYSC